MFNLNRERRNGITHNASVLHQSQLWKLFQVCNGVKGNGSTTYIKCYETGKILPETLHTLTDLTFADTSVCLTCSMTAQCSHNPSFTLNISLQTFDNTRKRYVTLEAFFIFIADRSSREFLSDNNKNHTNCPPASYK